MQLMQRKDQHTVDIVVVFIVAGKKRALCIIMAGVA